MTINTTIRYTGQRPVHLTSPICIIWIDTTPPCPCMKTGQTNKVLISLDTKTFDAAQKETLISCCHQALA